MRNTTATSHRKASTKWKQSNIGASTPKLYFFYGEIINGIKKQQRRNSI